MPATKVQHQLLIVLALILGAFVVLACGGGAASPTLVSTAAPAVEQAAKPTAAPAQEQATAAPVQEQATTAPATQEFKPGEVISIDNLHLAVLGWEELEPNDFAKPEEGEKFIAVELVVVNAGDKATNISSLAQMKLKDETAQQYDVDLMASTAAENKAPEGEIAAGEKLRGTVAFAVPVDVKGLQFVFDASIFSSGKVFVNLGDTPGMVEAPAELAGEAPQQLYNLGDAIKIGEIVLTVNEVTTPEASQFAKPEDGKRFLVVDVTVENTGSTAASLSSMLQMQLKDPSGQAYGVDLMASVASGGKTPDGELAAGEKIRGQVGYQVPTDAQDLMFVFDGDVFGAGKIFVKLP